MKLFFSVLAIILVSNIACAEQIPYTSPNVFAPQWSDVCPYAAYWSIDINKNYKKADKKYWQARRIQFDRELKACDQNAKDVSECYAQIIVVNKERSEKWKESYNQESLARGLKGAAAGAAVTAVGIAAMKYLF